MFSRSLAQGLSVGVLTLGLTLGAHAASPAPAPVPVEGSPPPAVIALATDFLQMKGLPGPVTCSKVPIESARLLYSCAGVWVGGDTLPSFYVSEDTGAFTMPTGPLPTFPGPQPTTPPPATTK